MMGLLTCLGEKRVIIRDSHEVDAYSRKTTGIHLSDSAL